MPVLLPKENTWFFPDGHPSCHQLRATGLDLREETGTDVSRTNSTIWLISQASRHICVWSTPAN